jgi:hypothetical protein
MNQIPIEKGEFRHCFVCEGLFYHEDLYYDTADKMGVVAYCETCHERHKISMKLARRLNLEKFGWSPI